MAPTNTASNIALLTPVPFEHLVSGVETISKVHKVAYGSMAYDRFVELDRHRKGQPVEVYIYASEQDGHANPHTLWRATYLRFVVSSPLGSYPSGIEFRPESTKKYALDNAGRWLMFWEAADLRPAVGTEAFAISGLTGFGKKKPYGNRFVRPEGPILIQRPA